MMIVEGNNCIVLGFGARCMAVTEEEIQQIAMWIAKNRKQYIGGNKCLTTRT